MRCVEIASSADLIAAEVAAAGLPSESEEDTRDGVIDPIWDPRVDPPVARVAAVPALDSRDVVALLEARMDQLELRINHRLDAMWLAIHTLQTQLQKLSHLRDSRWRYVDPPRRAESEASD